MSTSAPTKPRSTPDVSDWLADWRAGWRVTIHDEPGRQVFMVLRLGFTVLPLLMGLDKFANVMVDWPIYLASWYNDILPGNASDAMHIIGVVEIAAAVVVAVRPRWGAPIVAIWLAGIILDYLTLSGYYDVALRDFGLLIAALGLTRLAWHYDAPRRGARSNR